MTLTVTLTRRAFIVVPLAAAGVVRSHPERSGTLQNAPELPRDNRTAYDGTDCSMCFTWMPGEWHPDFDICGDCAAKLPPDWWHDE